MTTNELIRQYLKKNGIKQSYIKSNTGIDIYSIVIGRKRVLADDLVKIGKLLNVSPAVFLEGGETNETKQGK